MPGWISESAEDWSVDEPLETWCIEVLEGWHQYYAIIGQTFIAGDVAGQTFLANGVGQTYIANAEIGQIDQC